MGAPRFMPKSLKLCYGELFASAGTVRLFGQDARAYGRDDVAMVRRRIGVVHQDCQFLDHLTLPPPTLTIC